MHHHRFADELAMHDLPRPNAQPLLPAGFSLCPVAAIGRLDAVQWLMVQELYRQALEQAQAVARPSLPERDLLAVWN
jgi:hypothetical protein